MGSIPRTYYVYVLARPNGAPFYVGKGTGQRIFEHDKEARRGHNCHKCNIIRKIWSQGKEFQRYTVFATANEQEAYAYERELIALYGRENLANLTDGGEGNTNPSPETREKWASARRGKSPPNKGVPLTEQQKRHLSDLNRGKKLLPHVREVLIAHNTGRKYDRARVDKSALTQTGGKTYTAVAPDGTTHNTVVNLAAFERDHNLPKSGLYEVIVGKASHCKGWVAWINGMPTKPRPRMYTIIAPDGTRYDHIWNVAAFAREHAIDGHYLRAMLRGEYPHAKGWTGCEVK
jgi:hypothetical protein